MLSSGEGRRCVRWAVGRAEQNVWPGMRHAGEGHERAQLVCMSGSGRCSTQVGLTHHLLRSLLVPPAAVAAWHCLLSPLQNSLYVDEWRLSEVEQRCPAANYANEAPYPTPDFVPHNSTMPDIYPGGSCRCCWCCWWWRWC